MPAPARPASDFPYDEERTNEVMTDSSPQRQQNAADATGGLARVLDANFNRAAEGLRVVEDVLRLARDDGVLSEQTKRMRHALTELLRALNDSELVLARNVAGDVGRTIQTEQEYSRGSADDLLMANLKRAQQSLRAIEECVKTHSQKLAARAEALRYEAYQLEQAIVSSDRGRQALAQKRLCVLLDGRENLAAFERLSRELIGAGADMIQLRDKALTDRQLLLRGEILAQLTRGTSTRWVMNDRADLAALSHADGLHLGQDDLNVAQARRFLAPRQWVGISTHSIDQVKQAIRDGATYLGVGPTFASGTKHFEQLAGIELIRRVAGVATIPWFAIGGITLENVGQVLAAGATRIAVRGAIVNADSPGAAIGAFGEALAARPMEHSEKQAFSPPKPG